MPKRLLDDSFLSSPSLAKCSPRAQDAFPRFILLADDFGCFEAFPRVLVAKAWPYRNDVSEADVWAWLEEYVATGMACLWTEKERRWCYLTGWHGAHGQKKRAEYDPNAARGTPAAHGSKRKTPAPPPDLVAAVLAGERRAVDGKPPGTNREDEPEIVNDSVPARETTSSRSIPAEVPAESRSIPGPVVPVVDADAVPVAPELALSPAAAASPVVAILPCVGKGPKEYGVTLHEVASWQHDFPGVDVLAELHHARSWLAANKTKRKTHGGVPRFLVAWFTRNQNERATPQAKRTHGDLGAELRPWPTKLTAEERARARAELVAIAGPDFEIAPLQATGDPSIHPVEQIRAFHEKWRAVAEARP